MKNNRHWTTHSLFNSIINEEAIILVDPFLEQQFSLSTKMENKTIEREQKSECLLNGIRYI